MATLAPIIRPYFASWTFRCRWARTERRPQNRVNDVIPVVMMGQSPNTPVYDIYCDHPDPAPHIKELNGVCVRCWMRPDEEICPNSEETVPDLEETDG